MLSRFNIDVLFEGVKKSRKYQEQADDHDTEEIIIFEVGQADEETEPASSVNDLPIPDFAHLRELGYDPFEDSADYYYDPAAGEKAVSFFKLELHLASRVRSFLFLPRSFDGVSGSSTSSSIC